MNKQTEALKMAIEHIEHNGATTERKMVLQACKEALDTKRVFENEAQPAQEPVAVITPDNYGEPRLDFIGTFKYKATTAVNPDILLYTHPAPLQNEFAKTTSWQGLSDDDIDKMWEFYNGGWYDFAMTIEQELKRKNGFNDIKEKNGN